MAKPRSKANQGLPSRWTYKHGAYYYRVPTGLESKWNNKTHYRLGKSLPEAYRAWSVRLEYQGKVRTIGELLDRYALEVIPSKGSAATRTSNQNQLPMIKKVFGSLPLEPFQPKLIYQYVDRRSQKKKDPETGKVTGGRIAAHREVELLSHAFTKAVEWGYIDRHPFKGEVRLQGEEPRERYVEDEEVLACLSLASVRKKGSVSMIQAYIRLKLLTGMAQGDLLRLKEEHLKEEGIFLIRHKTKTKPRIYTWTDALRASVRLALASRSAAKSEFLFCNRRGEGYVNEVTGKYSGWKSMFQRFMERVVKETGITPFTEHDLRAKVGSDAESLAHASQLLAHADERTTKRIYRRKTELIKPAK